MVKSYSTKKTIGILTLTLLVVSLLGCTIIANVTARSVPLKLSPTSGPVGTKATLYVNGSVGFAPNVPVGIYFENSSTPSFTINTDPFTGYLWDYFEVPFDEPGTYTISAIDNSGNIGTATFVVLSNSSEATPTPTEIATPTNLFYIVPIIAFIAGIIIVVSAVLLLQRKRHLKK